MKHSLLSVLICILFSIYYYSENMQEESADLLDIKSTFYIGTELHNSRRHTAKLCVRE